MPDYPNPERSATEPWIGTRCPAHKDHTTCLNLLHSLPPCDDECEQAPAPKEAEQHG